MVMEIVYLGHSAFKIKTKTGTVVTDPFGPQVGFTFPKQVADIVTVSHRGHGDHDNVEAVERTTKREVPFVIDQPGEYEIDDISVFGYKTWHDDKEGKERGANTIYLIQAEEVRILHLGDLGHPLDDKLIEEIDSVDVLMIPVGGKYTIDCKMAAQVVADIDPTYILPMHYKTESHNPEMFAALESREDFVKACGLTTRAVKTLSLSKLSMPEDLSEIILFE